jgi:chorismate synthase
MIVLQTSKGPVEIRELTAIDEMIAAEKIQKQVWGHDTIPHPKELLIPVQHEGGLVAGAFNQNQELVGLIFGFPTNRPTVLHSQLLATLENWRGEGIGTSLKWFQRDLCLEHGYRNVRWTVDPLRAANAEINIRNLGGISSTYLQDYYGEMQGIDAGLPSDRLVVEWHLDSERVVSRARQKPEDRGFSKAQATTVFGDDDFPDRILLDLSSPSIFIRIPSNFLDLVKGNIKQALNWRLQTRILFQNYFAKGYSISEFTKINYPAYLLEKRL